MVQSAAICLIVKDEICDIAEWVDHHAGIGFDHLLIYDDGSGDGTRELLQRLSSHYPIHLVSWGATEERLAGCGRQMAAYHDACERLAGQTSWVLFADSDEFLVPPDEDSRVADLLREHETADSFALNWRIFGSSGLDQADGRLVMEAFDRRACLDFGPNRHVKMFCRPDKVREVVNPHFMEVGTPSRTVLGDEVAWASPGVTLPDAVVAGPWALHHYFTRSRRHWERRIVRAHSDGTVRDWDTFAQYDRNEVVDLTAIPWAARVQARLAGLGIERRAVPSEFFLPGTARHMARTPPYRAAPSASDITCFLDHFQDGVAKGWACHRPSLPASTSLQVHVDGDHLFDVTCDTFRADVEDNLGHGNVGFSFVVPLGYHDGLPHLLTLRTVSGGTVAMGTAGVFSDRREFTVFRQPVVRSNVDEMDQSMLKGWVVVGSDSAAPLLGSCLVRVTCDEEDVALVTANRPRPDVAAAIGCDVNCGFFVRLPDSYRTTRSRQIRFFVMPDGIELSRSPLTANFINQDYAMRLDGTVDAISRIAAELGTLKSQLEAMQPRSGFDVASYDPWARLYLRELQARLEQERRVRPIADPPLVSVVMPIYRPVLADFEAAVDSVVRQTYRNWELVLVDDGSASELLDATLAQMTQAQSRIRVWRSAGNLGIGGATNAALGLAAGAWVVFFDHDDLLVPEALECLVRAQAASGGRLLYSDEDKVDEFGFFSEPALKPDWSHRFLLGQNYINHLVMVERALAAQVGFISPGYDGAQDHEFLLKVSEALAPGEIVHVPEILYHWRKGANSTASSGAVKAYAVDAGIRAVGDHLARRGRTAQVSSVGGHTMYKVDWSFEHEPGVTIVIPFKDRAAMTRRCVEAVLTRTRYANLSIVLVDNNSTEPETRDFLDEFSAHAQVRVMQVHEEFNYSRLNNLAVAAADSDFVLLMNNDVFVQDGYWLRVLVNEALAADDVGAVGGKFLYENRTVQHAGVLLGMGGVAGHVFHGERESSFGYANLLVLAHEVSAVTAACMLVRRDVYLEVGGLDEVHLKVAFNDIDLCIKVREAGYRVIMAPDFVAEHHESISRGSDDRPDKAERFRRESATMIERWGETLRQDPYYSRFFQLEGRTYFDLVDAATSPGAMA